MLGHSSEIGIPAFKNRRRILHAIRLTRQFPNRFLGRVLSPGKPTPPASFKLIPWATFSWGKVSGLCFIHPSTVISCPALNHRVLPNGYTQTGDSGRRVCFFALPLCSRWPAIRHQRQGTAHGRDSAHVGSCVTGPVFTGRVTQPRHRITGPLTQRETGPLTQPCGVGESDILAFPGQVVRPSFPSTNCRDRQTFNTKRRSESPSV